MAHSVTGRLAALSLGLGLAIAAGPAGAGSRPVVVELFTSIFYGNTKRYRCV